MTAKDKASGIWGGRFASGPDALLEAINASIDFDQKLFRQDIRGSQAHAAMLEKQGILTPEDHSAIREGLAEIEQEIAAGDFTFSKALEDIHMNIETALKAKIGAAAGRLHTARSRNDQVATDLRLYVRDELDRLDQIMLRYMAALAKTAESEAASVMPGFTHVQPAQPITFGHHLLAYVEMASRDRGRLRDARARLNECPLGAAALAGTAFPIDRQMTAAALGFDGPTQNSLDSVSSRDFALEVMAALAIAGTHLSRLAEELVYWSSPGFGFVRLSDAFTTGSSIMPQKRNPDAAELVRGKTGRLLGAFQALAVVIKGLPMAYAKDLQEDKEPIFDALVTFELMVLAMTGMMDDLKVNRENMAKMAGVGFSTATDLADWLVRELNLPFRDAHHITGRLVAKAEAKGCDLHLLPFAEFEAENPAIHRGILDVLSVENSVKSRTSTGGTAPELVEAQARKWLKKLEKEIIS